MSVSYGGDVITFSDNTTLSSGSTGMKNRIINGDMRIHQRSNTINYLTTAGGGKYGVDRFNSTVSANTSNISVEQSTTVPTGQGFTNSLKYTVVTGATMSGNDLIVFQQRVEKVNVPDLNYGTADAKTSTISFWVRSSITGTYSVGVKDTAGDRNYLATYTINQSNTWEYKSVVIPGDTTGTWLLPRVVFSLGIGSTYKIAPNTWTGSVDGWGTTSDTNTWTQTSGNTFYITGLQWEKGSTATSFDFRHYGKELALCQRYCIAFGGNNTYESVAMGIAATGSTGYLRMYTPTMRTTPSVSWYGNWRLDDRITGSQVVTAMSAAGIFCGAAAMELYVTVASGLTSGRIYYLDTNNDTTARFILSAEV